MTRDVALRFDGVSKRYRLHHGWSLLSLRDEIARLGRRVLRPGAADADYFWALRDVSFEVYRGETVGLIGSNGAGKSTTLKVLSRVTVPTTGVFAVRGALSALIEVGAGFHPDLTGRENIFLNAAIMGMRPAEIAAKFDRIVAFAQVDQFIDTPVKYYSSGMQVRLGFSVAVHVDPDILLVDEVLAVGDAAFQAKCLNKIAELKERARTIVLVSHNMSNIVQHCDRVLWIDHGTLRAEGNPESIVEEYLSSVRAPAATSGPPNLGDPDSPFRLAQVTVKNWRGEAAEMIEYDRPASIEIEYEVIGAVEDPVLQVTFQDSRGLSLGGLTTRFAGVKLNTSRASGMARLTMSPVLFTRGAYTVSVAALDTRLQRYLAFRPNAANFTVDGPSVASRELSGHVVYPHRWDVDGHRE
jgi:ABC-type polysaccharide/polyol phosphate transport system ATPase subunit